MSSRPSSEFFPVVHTSPCLLSWELHSHVFHFRHSFWVAPFPFQLPQPHFKTPKVVLSHPILSHLVWLLPLPSPLQTALSCCSSCGGFNHTGSIPYPLWSIVVLL